MPFLVLRRNEAASAEGRSYRGTDRGWPTYADSQPEASPYNQFFLSHCEREGEDGWYLDASRARQMLHLLRKELDADEYELVEVVAPCDEPGVGGALLGYDLSASYGYSLLSWGLQLSGESRPSEGRLSDPVRTFCTLIEEHFRPLLNEHGLFLDVPTASLCLRCMMAVQRLQPGAWENEDVTSELTVVAVYLVAPD